MTSLAAMLLLVSVWVAASVTTVSFAAGRCSVKFEAPALSLVSVVAPVEEPTIAISLLLMTPLASLSHLTAETMRVLAKPEASPSVASTRAMK